MRHLSILDKYCVFPYPNGTEILPIFALPNTTYAMNRFLRVLGLLSLLAAPSCGNGREPVLEDFPTVSEHASAGCFPLAGETAAAICFDPADFPVVRVSAGMLADDVERLTGLRPALTEAATPGDLPAGPAVVAGTVGSSGLIDALAREGLIRTDDLDGKWESFTVQTVRRPGAAGPLLVIAGSDRRGTAYGLTTLSRAAGVSPWYWWADVTPPHRKALYVRRGRFLQPEPAVQYRGIFINDERFGGWALWAEQTFDPESGKVGPKTYRKVFELLLRLRGNLLWPAMHNGSQAFNADPENARLADEYAIVMGSSHCEQMLRNNEDEWKNAGTWGDFNYLTNRDNMVRYWEERVQANGAYENIYTLGLRGIHDYPMEGAGTTAERVAVMQQAIGDQRAILRRNVATPVEEIPQVLCTYEEVLEAYHNGLEVPEDVTLLWSDDKQGYTRNLSNPEERKRKGGAGIYYHLSYHGDPASWIWLSPLSPAFVATELTEAYTYGARKIWVFNVGDIKPAEKEISFAMDLAWDLERWGPENAHRYMRAWFSDIFGPALGREMAAVQETYYRLMASGKDSQVWFVDYSEQDIRDRLQAWAEAERQALRLEKRVPPALRDAYFELFLYPVRGASLLNRYQLLARCSMAHAAVGDGPQALADGAAATEAYTGLNAWTERYNKELLGGKWDHFFSWQPYHWFRSPRMDAPLATESLLEEVKRAPAARSVSPEAALSDAGALIRTDTAGDIPIWMRALTPIRNFSKAAADNAFCTVSLGEDSFTASATPINNIWHATQVGPMWSRVGTLHLREGENRLRVSGLASDARLDRIYLGVCPPFEEAPAATLPASAFRTAQDSREGRIRTVRSLGYADGVLVLPFDSPSYDTVEDAPSVEYDLILAAGENRIEIRTLPTLHVYEGRQARYAASLDGGEAAVFDIHTDDFSAEWRKNVLQGYSSRSLHLRLDKPGKHTLRICLLDPGIVLQDIRIYSGARP